MDINRVFVNGVRHHETVLYKLWGLVQSRDKVDFGLAGCGRLLRAHQLILGVFFEPEKLMEIAPQHWQGSSLDLLLEFIYLGAVSVPEKQMDTLLELARQLDFTMLVDALLMAKSRINMASFSTTTPGLLVTDVRSCDPNCFPSTNELSSMPSAVHSHTNPSEAVNPAQNDWEPVMPKLEPISNDWSRIAEERQQNVDANVSADVVRETECKVHLSGNSVLTENEIYSEMEVDTIKSSCDFVATSGTSNATDQSEVVDISSSDSESQANVDSLQRSWLPSNDTDVAANPKSLDDRLSYSSAQSKTSNVVPSADHQKKVQSTNVGEVSCDLELNKLTGATIPGVELTDKRLIRRKRQLRDKLLTPSASGHYRLRKRNQESGTKSNKITKSRDNTGASKSDAPTDIKGYECSVCLKAFERITHLAIHLRTCIHTGEKHFKCELCPVEFITEEDLQTHSITHTIKKPYKCELCGKEFSSGNFFNIHMRNHTGENRNKCHHCQMAFPSSTFAEWHLQNTCFP